MLFYNLTTIAMYKSALNVFGSTGVFVISISLVVCCVSMAEKKTELNTQIKSHTVNISL